MRWSGARFSHTAASARNCSVQASRKLVHSTTKASSSSSPVASIASTSGTSVLPSAAVRTPAARRIATVSSVVVVLPSVPVTASIGRGAARTLLLPPVGELDLADERHAELERGERPTGASRARRAPARSSRTAPANAGRRRRVRASSSTPSALASARLASSTRSSLDDDVVTVALQRAHGRRAGDRQPVDEHRHGPTVPTCPREVGDEDREGARDADRRDQPEADDHGGLGPADELEVVVDRRHAEQPPLAARRLEHAHLDRRPSPPPSR